MPELTVEVMMCCPMWASNFQIESKKSGNIYNMTVNPYDPSLCVCPSFKFSGEYGDQDCKHLQLLMANGCFYHPQHGEAKAWNEFNFEDNGITWLNSGGNVVEPKQPCPGCGNPMISIRVGV